MAFLDINHSDWIIKKLKAERGGIQFMLPNAEGKIYLGWSDLYHVDVDLLIQRKTLIHKLH